MKKQPSHLIDIPSTLEWHDGQDCFHINIGNHELFSHGWQPIMMYDKELDPIVNRTTTLCLQLLGESRCYHSIYDYFVRHMRYLIAIGVIDSDQFMFFSGDELKDIYQVLNDESKRTSDGDKDSPNL